MNVTGSYWWLVKIGSGNGLVPRGFRFMLNALLFDPPDISYPMFWNSGPGSRDTFVCTVKIGKVNCAQATAFIFHAQTSVLVKLLWSLRQKMYMGQVTKVRLSCYLVLLSNDQVTKQAHLHNLTYIIYKLLIQWSAATTQSNIKSYCTQHCSEWDET